MGIFAQIADTIRTEKVRWCTGEYVRAGGDTVSACLMGHVEMASGLIDVVMSSAGRLSYALNPEAFNRYFDTIDALDEVLLDRFGEFGEFDPDYVQDYSRESIVQRVQNVAADDFERRELVRDSTGGFVVSYNDSLSENEEGRLAVLSLLADADERYPDL